MDNRSLYILAGYDDKTEKILSGIQNKLYESGFDGFQTRNIPMHISLGSYDTGCEEELKSRLKKTAEEQKEFEVTFTHIGLFRLPANDVLFIAPEVNKEMLQLKDGFWDNNDQFTWSAHSTLLIDKPEKIFSAMPIVLDEFKSFSGCVEKLYLYEFWPTRHILTVQLK